ncbi:MAG: serine O-acetyltransferase [Promethearchaeota archaeon]|nr:MAG: serine O-acetyltransferase [Candidatus Lokiarchaeota archaeon]
MKIDKFINCLNCGKRLSPKEQTEGPSCAECVLGIKFEITDLDHKNIDEELAKILDFFVSDVSAAFNKDPAAKSLLEVLTGYPGIKAVLLYRVAHFFWKLGMPFVPRYISDIAREITAIEIHPGAEIGSEFFIDHGAGVVIGETAVIGDNVTLYAGVVLGGTTNDPVKRHPTLGSNIVVGTGAKILGPIKIGDNVKIGANSVVVNNVPPNSVVVGVPGRIVSKKGEKIDKIDLRHGDLPDPLSITIQKLEQRIRELEDRVLDHHRDQEKDEIEIYYGEYGGGI